MKGWKRIMAAAVCASLALTACGTGGEKTDGAALGRYVETQLSVPDSQLFASHMTEEGELLFYGLDMQGGLWEFRQQWPTGSEDWIGRALEPDLPDGISLDTISRAENGDMYYLSSSVEIDETAEEILEGYTFSSILYRVDGASGKAVEIPVDWYIAAENGRGTTCQDVMLLDNGDLLIDQVFDGYCQYGPDGSFKRVYGEWFSEGNGIVGAAVSGMEVALLNLEASAVLIYDALSYELKNTVPFDNMTDSTLLAAGREGAFYLIGSQGIYRLAPGGSKWERLVDGELGSLGMPTVTPKAFFAQEDGSLLVLAGEEGRNILLAYQYDPDITTLPEHELTVYALQESATLRQAAALHQRNHPETKVTVQIGGSYEGGTSSDVVRALNTELLAGKGPDVLVLDGLNVDSYIDKGTFLDLRSLLEEFDSRLLSQVAAVYDREDGLYALPMRFQMPVVFAEAERLEHMRTLADAAAFAAENPQKGLIGNRQPDVLMRLLMPSSLPAWSDGKNIGEEGLAEFLHLLKEIYRQPAESYPREKSGIEYNYNLEAFHWAFGRSLTQMKVLTGYESLSSAQLALEALGEGDVSYMPGMAEAVYIPTVVTAVNSSSRQPERAKEFVMSLLDFQVQKARLEEGFPVLLEALGDHQYNEFMYYFFTSDSFGGEELGGGDVPVSLQAAVEQLALEVKTPYKADHVLTEMIIDEAEGYFTGEKTLEQAVSDVLERARLYLAE